MEATETHDEYGIPWVIDLDDDVLEPVLPGAAVRHTVLGWVGTMTDKPAQWGQLPVEVAGETYYCYPENLEAVKK